MTCRRPMLATMAGALLFPLAAPGEEAALRPPGPDELAFAVENMDTEADPAVDFYRYATGGWLGRAVRPDHLPTLTVFDFMRERLKAQMTTAVAEAGAAAATAAKGSPAQQVGSFYNAYMDIARRDAAGIEPIRGELDRIAAIGSMDDLTRFMAHLVRIGGPALLAGFGPFPDFADAKRYAIIGVGGQLGLEREDLYDDPPESPRRAAYRAYVEQVMTVAGYAPEEAARIAGLTLDIETGLHGGKLTPVERGNPANQYNPRSFEEVQAQIPELDLAAYFEELGYAVPERIVMIDPNFLPVLSELLRTRPLPEIRDYAAFLVINAYAPAMTTEFEEPVRKLTEALTGVTVLEPREVRVLALLGEKLGHPVSQVYVDSFFSEETRKTAGDMIARIEEVFRDRIPTRDWLSAETRAAALEKLDKLTYRVGYPDHWIDYSGVEIGPDPVANLMAIAAFEDERMQAKFGMPVEQDEFSDRSTLPIVVNAAYNPHMNGFEVPAAILQPPMFEASRDAPLYFCRLGAVIGHEMTHGFDSGGRLFDGDGNLRDWWTAGDAAAFDAEAEKLVEQADAFEVLPGLRANGPLNVKENMADVGGITLAHEALMRYLAEHPEEDVEIEGLTPTQRCFIAWAQTWAWKATEPFVRMLVATNDHPPNSYRTTAPLQHLDAFYDAFGIEEGDPMWLAPELRVNAW